MLRTLWTLIVFGASTAVLATLAAVASVLRPGSHAIIHLGRPWSGLILGAMGAEVEYEGLDRARSRLPCIYISNHQSNADIWALLRVVPETTRFVAKQSLFRTPFLGWALRTSGFVPIDRGDRQAAIRSLELAAAKIRQGASILLFPEGTRSRDGRLQPFKKGPFHLAIHAAVPVVPVSIRGSWDVLRPGSVRVRPGRIVVRFLPHIDVATFAPGDYAALLAAVHEAIRRDQEQPGARRPP